MNSGPDWKGMEYIQAAPKLLFIIINAPVVNFFYKVTGNAGLSVAILPLLLSIAGLFAVYELGRRLYGIRGAYWAGLVYAVMPYLVLQSSLMHAEQYYIVFYLFGALMLNSYLRSRKTSVLILTMSWFAAICKVRPEGIIIFFIALVSIITWSLKEREHEPGRKNEWLRTAFLSTACLVFINLFFMLIVEFDIVKVDAGSISSAYSGKILGSLARRITSLFNIALPGGLTNTGNKFGYLMDNWQVVFLAGLAWSYDILKTVFILPTRVVPPLILVFCGMALADKESRDPDVRFTERFLLASLLLILFFPVIYLLSFSRYMYIISPVAVFLAARGLSFLERRFASPDGLRWRLLTPSTIITCIIILYVSTGFYLLQAGDFLRRGAATVFSNEYQENGKRNTVELVKWLGENYSGNQVALMGEGEWWHMVEGMNTLRFPYRMGNVNGIWRVLPVSSAAVLDTLRNNSPALMVLARSQFFQIRRAGSKNYFNESLSRNLAYSDDGLELMRPAEENDPIFIFQELSSFWETDSMPDSFKLLRIIAAPEDQDTIKVFGCGIKE